MSENNKPIPQTTGQENKQSTGAIFQLRSKSLVEVVGILVQTIIAFFMYWTLRQTGSTLAVTGHQLESVMSPVLTVTYDTRSTTSPYIMLQNAGRVTISDLQVVGLIEAVFDNEYKLRAYTISSLPYNIRNQLSIGERVGYNCFQLALLNQIKLPDVAGQNQEYGFLLRYRRSVDMQPHYKLVTFFSWIEVGNTKRQYAPVDPFAVDANQGLGFISPNGEPPPHYRMRTEIKRLLKQIEIPIDETDVD